MGFFIYFLTCFCHSCCRMSFLKEFNHPFECFTWRLVCWGSKDSCTVALNRKPQLQIKKHNILETQLYISFFNLQLCFALQGHRTRNNSTKTFLSIDTLSQNNWVIQVWSLECLKTQRGVLSWGLGRDEPSRKSFSHKNANWCDFLCITAADETNENVLLWAGLKPVLEIPPHTNS